MSETKQQQQEEEQPSTLALMEILPVSAVHPNSCPNWSFWEKGRYDTYLHTFCSNTPTAQSQQQPATTQSARDQLICSIRTFFSQSGISMCNYKGCEEFRQKCRQALPECQWPAFHECIVTWMSCWMHAHNQRKSAVNNSKFTVAQLKSLHTQDGTPFRIDPTDAILARVDDLRDLSTANREEAVFVTDIIKIFHWLNLWLYYYAAEKSNNPSQIFSFGDEYDRFSRLQRLELIRSIKEVKQDVGRIWRGVCPSSVWNLSVSQNDQYGKMLAIIDYLRVTKANPFPHPHRNHDSCTAQVCTHAHEDTVKIEQLHMCSDRDNCPSIQIPISKPTALFRSPGPWVTTAWDISLWDPDAPSGTNQSIDEIISGTSKKYMAISHVWSDGTGVGLKGQGTVNSCLINFWVRIAKKNNCVGLWWDTICLPTEPQPRRNALNVMLSNFSEADVVVIHDKELASTPWTNGGECQNAAIAVVLSNWFTRGWTAAEFGAAKSTVLVVLRNPDADSSEPYTVDLASILPWGPKSRYYSPGGNGRGPLPTLAHLSASTIIGGLYSRDYSFRQRRDFEMLMAILKSRSTAWEKDRLIIATLICSFGFHDHADFDFSLAVPQFTQKLLVELNNIPRTAIFHGEVPMVDHGGWSWCPPSIFNLGNSGFPHSDREGFEPRIRISKSGMAHGWFYATVVRPEYLDELLPYGSHPLVVARIQEALETPAECLLLRSYRSLHKLVPALLVIPVGVATSAVSPKNLWYLGCRYVGCVYHMVPPEQQEPPRILCSIGDDLDAKGEPRKGNSAELWLQSWIKLCVSYSDLQGKTGGGARSLNTGIELLRTDEG